MVEFRRRTFVDSDRDENKAIARPAYEEMQLGENFDLGQADANYAALLGRQGSSRDGETAQTQSASRHHFPAEIHNDGEQADVGSELSEDELPAFSDDIDDNTDGHSLDGAAAADERGISRKRRPSYTNVIIDERDASNVDVSYENVTLQLYENVELG